MTNSRKTSAEIKRQMAFVNNRDVRRKAAELHRLNHDYTPHPVSLTSSEAVENKENAEDLNDEPEGTPTIEIRKEKKLKIKLKEQDAKNLNASAFKNIFNDIFINQFEPCLANDLKALSGLARSGKGLQTLFQPALTKTKMNKLREIAQHVVYGEKDELEHKLRILSQNHSELLKDCLRTRVLVVDYSGRQIEGTLYQLALGADDVSREAFLDEGMVEMIEGFLQESLKNQAQAEISKQQKEQFPEGWKAKEKAELQQDVAELKKVIEAIADAKEDPEASYAENLANIEKQCAAALQHFRDYLDAKKNRVIKFGRHFNPKWMSEGFNHYDANYNRLSQERYDRGDPERWDAPKNILVWRKVVGYIQRFLPACLAQAFCQSLYELLYANNENRGEKLKRSFKFRYDPTCSFYPLSASSGVGYDFACAGWVDGRGAPILANEFRVLCQSKTARTRLLCGRGSEANHRRNGIGAPE